VAVVGYLLDESVNAEVLMITDEGTGDTIEIQRALSFDAQDIAKGMDTYCLVRSRATHYGGIVSWVVQSSELSMELSETAAGSMSLPTSVTIPIDAVGADLLRQHLPHLCQPRRA